METLDFKKYKLIIFDCDGTLVDSEPISNRIVAELFREVGEQITNREAYDIFAGTSFADIIQHLENKLGRALEIDFEKTFRQRTKIAFENELQAIPGSLEFVQELSVPIAIASNGPRVKMKVTLATTGFDDYFNSKNIFSAYDIQKWKPKPDLYLHVLKELNSNPEQALVIEDTISGALGAINANLDVIVYCPFENRKPFVDLGITTFNSFNSLREIYK